MRSRWPLSFEATKRTCQSGPNVPRSGVKLHKQSAEASGFDRAARLDRNG